MSSKTIIAVLTVFLGAVAAAPAGAQAATLCPRGVTDATYCAVGNASGVTWEQRFTKVSGNSSVEVTVRCKSSSGCTGRLYLESSSGASSGTSGLSLASASARTIYGTSRYAVKDGTRAALRIRFTAAARRTLKRTGRLAVTVAAVSNGVRSVIGRLSIKGLKKRSKRVQTRPGRG
jgi:hypothetical protein